MGLARPKQPKMSGEDADAPPQQKMVLYTGKLISLLPSLPPSFH